MKRVKFILLLFCIILSTLSCKKTETKKSDLDLEEEVVVNTTQEDSIPNNSIQEPSSQEENKKIIFKFLYDDEYWEKYDLTYAQFQTKKEYEDAIVSYMDEIAQLYHKEDWYQQYTENKDTIYIRLTIEDMPMTGRSEPPKDYTVNSLVTRLIFTDAMFNQYHAPISHELTHIITMDKDTNKSCFSLSITEGLCEYASNLIGTNNTSNFGIDVHTFYHFILKRYLQYEVFSQEEIDAIIALIGEEENEYPEGFVEKVGGTWILYSYSFVDYLIRTYGMDSMMKIFSAEDATVYYDYNADGLTGLKKEWQKFLEDYEPVMSDEEIENCLLEIMN